MKEKVDAEHDDNHSDEEIGPSRECFLSVLVPLRHVHDAGDEKEYAAGEPRGQGPSGHEREDPGASHSDVCDTEFAGKLLFLNAGGGGAENFASGPLP